MTGHTNSEPKLSQILVHEKKNTFIFLLSITKFVVNYDYDYIFNFVNKSCGNVFSLISTYRIVTICLLACKTYNIYCLALFTENVCSSCYKVTAFFTYAMIDADKSQLHGCHVLSLSVFSKNNQKSQYNTVERTLHLDTSLRGFK